VTIEVTFIEKRGTDQDQNRGHNGTSIVTLIEKRRTDPGQIG